MTHRWHEDPEALPVRSDVLDAIYTATGPVSADTPVYGVTGQSVTAIPPPYLLQEDCPCRDRGSQQWQDHGPDCPWRYRLNKKLAQRMARHEKRLASSAAAEAAPQRWPAHPALASRIQPEDQDWAGFVPTREQAAATACTCGAGTDADWKQHAPGRCMYRRAIIAVARHEQQETEKIRQELAEFDAWFAAGPQLPPAPRIPEGCCAHCHGPKEAATFLLCRYCRELGTELPPVPDRKVNAVPLLTLLAVLAGWALLILLIHGVLP